MGGSNPYIEQFEAKVATEAYTVTFKCHDQNTVVNVDPSRIPYGPTGQPGSILDIAMGAGIDVEHACGGVCACSTCHVIVKEGLDTCNEATDDELDQLDEAPAITLQSRLACQCVPDGSQNLLVEIPEWNKNLVKESH
ncbi:2Fe-2S iron-sulfur cluster-binding protein [Candidatus Nitronereus thalassa]|uniref:2Fe-2S iron-sulfur cluster-binding protein n=1 Tax=Candidatus Nitronereus thalassa TaxID=3020898 RepID=A0ABU3K739_9BACT|nr:2Fe-2S iron-sulfur cluster-binding protein [Candidatus Nitronereus thalassa]MDT7042170.1 2Fe-2S iron-sulfur cluster-binding protein [Candidatus Nitronereus thalassa]